MGKGHSYRFLGRWYGIATQVNLVSVPFDPVRSPFQATPKSNLPPFFHTWPTLAEVISGYHGLSNATKYLRECSQAYRLAWIVNTLSMHSG